MGKTEEAAIYRAYIEKMKKKTKEMNKEEKEKVDMLKTFFERLDSFEQGLEKRDMAQKMNRFMPERVEQPNELETLKETLEYSKKWLQGKCHQLVAVGLLTYLI